MTKHDEKITDERTGKELPARAERILEQPCPKCKGNGYLMVMDCLIRKGKGVRIYEVNYACDNCGHEFKEDV